MHPYLDAEREWIIVHENGKKLAFFSIYLAAEVPCTVILIGLRISMQCCHS